MSDYKIGMKYQDGTAWLCGRVASDEQMNTAIRLTFQICECQPRGQRLDGRRREAEVSSDESRNRRAMRRCRRANIRPGGGV